MDYNKKIKSLIYSSILFVLIFWLCAVFLKANVHQQTIIKQNNQQIIKEQTSQTPNFNVTDEEY